MWGEVMRDYYGRVKRGDPQLAARTPDDQIRLVSYVFANTKQLDKVRLGGPDVSPASWQNTGKRDGSSFMRHTPHAS